VADGWCYVKADEPPIRIPKNVVVLKPDELCGGYAKPSADLVANIFRAVRNAVARIACNLNAGNNDSSVWKVYAFDQAHPVYAVEGLESEKRGLICFKPERVSPSSGKIFVAALRFGPFANLIRYIALRPKFYNMLGPSAECTEGDFVVPVEAISITPDFRLRVTFQLAMARIVGVVMLGA
jgi:hypothetical protein